jgi:AcrR family transcriptional regulator
MSNVDSPTANRNEKDGIQRILNAAVDEFCRAGLAGAKLDVIALEANVSKQLIHHYFRTKAELYVAVINHISSEAIDALSAIDYEHYPPQQAIVQFLQQAFDLFTRWPLLAGLYNDQAVYAGEHMPECLDMISRSPELMERLIKIFMQGQKNGEFLAEHDPQQCIAAALMVVIGYFTNSPLSVSFIPSDISSTENIARWRDFSVNFVMNAIKA